MSFVCDITFELDHVCYVRLNPVLFLTISPFVFSTPLKTRTLIHSFLCGLRHKRY